MSMDLPSAGGGFASDARSGPCVSDHPAAGPTIPAMPADRNSSTPPFAPTPAPAAVTVPIPPPVHVDRVMVEQRARDLATRSIKTTAKARGLRLAMSMVDLTTLEGRDSPEKVRALCRRAMHPCAVPVAEPVPPVAAVCVYPNLVATAVGTLGDSPVRIAAVATGFPSGQYPLEIRLEDVAAAIDAGADEIDMVINRNAMLRGDLETVAAEIAAVRRVCLDRVAPPRPGAAATPPPRGGTHLKIILETGELETYDLVRRASDLAIAAATAGPLGAEDAWADGCVFIKTSTGKVSPAATMPVTLVMLEAIRDHYLRTGRRVGMKPAGGIRTAKDALRYLVLVKETLGDAWLSPHLFRFGASSLADDLVRQVLRQERGGYAAAYDVSET
jgi:deoxyribose-phosphate aldolase